MIVKSSSLTDLLHKKKRKKQITMSYLDKNIFDERDNPTLSKISFKSQRFTKFSYHNSLLIRMSFKNVLVIFNLSFQSP